MLFQALATKLHEELKDKIKIYIINYDQMASTFRGGEAGNIKELQADKKSVHEATAGMEVAISLSGANFERQLKEEKFLYTQISENQFKKFKQNKDLLSQDEIKILQELSEIKRKINPEWGV
jgi:translation initiation factor 5B